MAVFVFSADNSKTSITVWAKYVKAAEKSSLVLSENDMDNRL